MKAPDSTGAFTAGKGGVALSWYVEDVDASAKVIEEAGGKILSGMEKEGESGLLRCFADTEGNVGSIYMLVK
jgi:predicted enzyme related to lactoylglutathione lyase